VVNHDLSIAGCLTARFRSACDIHHHDAIKRQLHAHIPGLVFGKEGDQPPIITIEHHQSANPRLECTADEVRYYGAAGEAFPVDLYHLLYGITRRALLERNLYCVHAACVGGADGYHLIIGHSGSGKTTLAQNLVEHHGMTLFSGNKTVIRFEGDGGLTAIAGTPTMTALDKDFNRFAYGLANDQYAPKAEVPITAITIIRVNDGVEETQTLGGLSALHTLYPYFMDTVNADVIVNGKDVFDGTPPAAAKDALVAGLTQAFAHNIPVRKISGSMAYMCRKVAAP